MKTANEIETFSAWNPGLRSELPREYLHLATVFHDDNVSTSLKTAHELAEFSGLPPYECVAFRAERLIVHEVLIRVTADLSVYAGQRYEDLGINFRRMASAVLETHVAGRSAELKDLFQATRLEAERWIRSELEKSFFQSRVEPLPQVKPSIWVRFLGSNKANNAEAASQSTPAELLRSTLSQWEERSTRSEDDLEIAVLEAIGRVIKGIAGKHGRVVGDIDLITSIATTLVANNYCSRVLGDALDPIVRDAARREDYKLLPVQDKPVVMNAKGASASGKSTLRPLQQKLAERIGVNWNEFALISPDIWRKYLLDYGSLGSAYKYAGMMTGREVEIIDRKLDDYMARKAELGSMTHLLIDRFRFDSFVPDADEPVRLLTRFGDLVYMFFMVTPPAETVERAWRRGQMVGRYKAVDDLLAHNVEAFSGMPELFFTWALRADKRVHYEFLDNSVALGSLPKTIAYGWNGEMNVLDVNGLLDIDRFRNINVEAQRPEDVYKAHCMAAQRNTGFLERCARLIPKMNFADQATGLVYARLEGGKWTWCDTPLLEQMLRDDDTRAGLAAIGLTQSQDHAATGGSTSRLDQQSAHTLGAWGQGAHPPVAGSFA